MDKEKENKKEEVEKEKEPGDLIKKLEEYQKQKEEYLAGWQRERADFFNYKKEEMERIGEILKYANEGFIMRVLPILDNFEIIEKKLPEDLKNDERVKGLLQTKSQILDFLRSQGVEEIKSVGEKFDPHLHEVVEEVVPSEASAKEGEEKREPGIIIEEIQKGYKINGELLRPARVKISK